MILANNFAYIQDIVYEPVNLLIFVEWIFDWSRYIYLKRLHLAALKFIRKCIFPTNLFVFKPFRIKKKTWKVIKVILRFFREDPGFYHNKLNDN